MKKTILLLIALISLNAWSQNAGNAGEYMNYFSTEYSKIQKDMWDYTSSVSHGKSARKVEKRRMELIQTSNAALSKAKMAKDFEGDKDYRDSVVSYLTLVNLVLKEDYGKIVNMEEIAEQSYDLMEAYMTARDQSSEKLSEASHRLAEAQRVFAKKHNVNLIESTSELDKKMEIAGEVYKHYNEVYLIFFKAYKQEAYLMDALNKKDLSAIEQNRAALIAVANEGIEKLQTVNLYQNDKSMVNATIQLLKFYIQEADVEFPKMTDFLLKSENFEKIKADFDKKKEKDRTQEDVDAYNKGVNEMNGSLGAYNGTNQRLNTDRNKHIDQWNKTAQKFTDQYVPKN